MRTFPLLPPDMSEPTDRRAARRRPHRTVRPIAPTLAHGAALLDALAEISHELRGPLAIIALHSGNLEMLYDQLDDERRRLLIAAIRRQAGLLDGLLGGLLELARAQAGREPARAAPVDLGRLLCDELDQHAPLAEQRGLTLTAEIGECPPAWADERQLRQVIRNLLGNALKYTPAGGAVHCRCAGLACGADEAEWPGATELRGGLWPALLVRDSGVGIAAQELPRLFERFYRAGGGAQPGSGLGLAIVREIVQRAGGRVAVASAPGHGSAFAVYLPPASG